jgi:hypothetical protein
LPDAVEAGVRRELKKPVRAGGGGGGGGAGAGCDWKRGIAFGLLPVEQVEKVCRVLWFVENLEHAIRGRQADEVIGVMRDGVGLPFGIRMGVACVERA